MCRSSVLSPQFCLFHEAVCSVFLTYKSENERKWQSHRLVKSRITPVLVNLHWFPIGFRIEFKILIITYKTHYGLPWVPEVLFLVKTGEFERRSRDNGLLLTVYAVIFTHDVQRTCSSVLYFNLYLSFYSLLMWLE